MDRAQARDRATDRARALAVAVAPAGAGGGGVGAGGGAGGGGGGGPGPGGPGGGVDPPAAGDRDSVCPPMVTMPLRAAPLFAAIVIVTLPGPLPLPGPVKLIQLLVVCAAHAQPDASATVTVVVPPLAVNEDCPADAASQRTRACQMLPVAAPPARSDEKYSVCVSLLRAG